MKPFNKLSGFQEKRGKANECYFVALNRKQEEGYEQS